MKKILLPAIWILSLVGIFFLTGSFNKSTTQFFGITDNREQSVSFQEPVEITEIMVIEGQHIKKGSILLKAKRSELVSQQSVLNNQFDELQARQNESQATTSAEIKVLRAKQRAELAGIDAQIQQLRSKQRINNQLYQNITGSSVQSASQSGPLMQQVEALRNQRRYLSSSLQAQINALRTRLSSGAKPVLSQKKQLSDQLAELKRQSEELTIYADFTGRIGSVNHKKGEHVASFQGIITVHGLSPDYVKGYIHENVSNDVRVGQDVWIHSIYAKDEPAVKGFVESLGSRIIEYPERLRKNGLVRSWGREANIRLERNNPLLLGEKVQISFSHIRPQSAEAFLTPIGESAQKLVPNAFAEKFEFDQGSGLGEK